MRVWQALWDDSGRLLLWAEGGRMLSEIIKNGPLEESDSIREHPFAFGHERLKEELDLLEFDPDSEDYVVLKLPSDDLGPLNSPRLVPRGEVLAERSDIRFWSEWRVPVLVLEPVPALAFLTSLPSEMPHGAAIDHSVTFWVEATKLLVELLCRGRFLPTLYQGAGGHHSRWAVVMEDSRDKERFDCLVRAMPPLCKSLLREEQEAPDSRELIENFIERTGDELIRAFLSRKKLLEHPRLSDYREESSVIMKWLKSLSEADSVIEGTGYELTKLETRLRRWNQVLVTTGKNEAITYFELIPPEEFGGEEKWELIFGLQASHDRREKISSSQLFSGDLGFLLGSEQPAQFFEDKLLCDLGKIGKIFEPVQRALQSVAPTQILLSTEEAYRMLRDVSPNIESQGHILILPDWWKKATRSLGLKLNVSTGKDLPDRSPSPAIGLDRLVDFTWQISVGETSLSANQFRDLVKEQRPLVNVGGQWVELRSSEVEATLAFLDMQSGKQSLRLADALRYGFGESDHPHGLPVIGFDATGWVEHLLSAEEKTLEAVKQPQGFTGELRPYQEQGVAWMWFLARLGCGGCLADDMGLGKTIQFLALLLHERRQIEDAGGTPYPTLLVVPMSILENWLRESSRFSPELRVYIHHGASRLEGEAFLSAVSNNDLVLTTYNLVYRDEELMNKITWGRITLDEAQNIKNLNTKQTIAIRQLVYEQLNQEGRERIVQRIALTGTPLENHLEELWSIMDFCNPGYLGTISEFRRKYVAPIERYRDTDAGERLAKLIKPFILRRVKTDRTVIDDLPEKIEMDVYTGLTDEQAALYQSIIEQMIPAVDQASGMKRKGLVLSTITKLKQVCDHPTLFLKDGSSLSGRSGKLQRLEELLDVIIAEGDRVLIFTQYAQMGGLLREYLQERYNKHVPFLHGGVPQKMRQRIIDEFQEENGPPIFVLSLKVGGLGLNLTAANQIVHFDQWWNPAVHEQATDRAFRIGQRRNVQVRRFICKGTLEERIAEMLNQKKDLANQIVTATRSELTQLSTNELRELLELGT